MKIISKASVAFKIGDTTIFPGGHNYPRLKPKDPAVRYQLGILKSEGILDFGEIVEVDPEVLPFTKKEIKKEKKNAQADVKANDKKAGKNKQK